jgi:PAS domain S-box-containing protein
MSSNNYASALEDGLDLQSEVRASLKPLGEAFGIGILIADSVNRRVLESASVQLELKPILLSPESLPTAQLNALELIVVDASLAAHVHSLLDRTEEKTEGIQPTIIAVLPEADEATPTEPQPDSLPHRYDAVITLPQPPAQLAGQLSLLLYTHRSFALRYHNALEELHLNRRIFRSVTSGISVANALLPDMPLTYVNPAFEVMTGYALEEVVGRNCRFLQGEDQDQAPITLLREAIQDRREVTVVLKNFRKDGTSFWNELSLSPVRNREGEVTHIVGIQTDVTARVEFEAALRESEKLAAVGRLASSIAHEINNPLESVMNLIYLAERSTDPDETRQYLITADSELQRVKLITTQSLRFFKQSTKPQAIGCTEMLDSVLSLYHSRLHNAAVRVERRERFNDSIVCMESEIRQVLNNLVGNAIDAMFGSAGPDSKAGRLLIRTRTGRDWASNRPGVVLTIADTGIGIDSNTLKNIYKAFYTTKGIGGTGLGLWISSEIVTRHHGRLLVRSSQRPGHIGTVFQLFLPLQGLASGD